MMSFTTRLGLNVCLLVAAAASATAQGTSQTPPARLDGSALYTNYCASCHGTRATGDGPLATMLRKPPADLTLLARRNGGKFSREMVARIIDGRKPLSGHGGGDMPVWGEAFGKSLDSPESTPDKIAALVSYLESIQVP